MTNFYNKEERRVYDKAWRLKNKKHLEYYHAKRKIEGKSWSINKQKEHEKSIKLQVFTHYCNGTPHCMSPTCEVPGGAKDIRSLSIDHIDGDGAVQKEIYGTGNHFYSYLLKHNFPSEFHLQVLCMNCQFTKRWENGENTSCKLRSHVIIFESDFIIEIFDAKGNYTICLSNNKCTKILRITDITCYSKRKLTNIVCDFCSKTIKKFPSNMNHKHHFCSPKCHYQWNIGRKRSSK